MERSFKVQKSDIPGVAIACDHAGEQVNRKDKTRGELKGITKNQNRPNRYTWLHLSLQNSLRR